MNDFSIYFNENKIYWEILEISTKKLFSSIVQKLLSSTVYIYIFSQSLPIIRNKCCIMLILCVWSLYSNYFHCIIFFCHDLILSFYWMPFIASLTILIAKGMWNFLCFVWFFLSHCSTFLLFKSTQILMTFIAICCRMRGYTLHNIPIRKMYIVYTIYIHSSNVYTVHTKEYNENPQIIFNAYARCDNEVITSFIVWNSSGDSFICHMLK